MKRIILAILLFSGFQGFAQDLGPERNCLMPQMRYQLYDGNVPTSPEQLPQFRLKQDEYFLIPVVFHIIHQNGPENIHDSFLLNQIDVLNEDFGRYGNGFNAHPDGADTRIRFCLASLDPEGNPTNGIIRVESEHTKLETTNEMATKNLSRWDQNRYLNIWVVFSIDGASQTQGYAYLPRDAAGRPMDGIVMVYRFIGRNGAHNPILYRKGRTLTHEVGHYLNLLHTWGGDRPGQGGCNDDDGIADTPLCSGQYFAQPPLCVRPQQCGTRRMTENYMDYSTDDCVNIFTNGQAQFMWNAIMQYRPQLVSFSNIVSTGCQEIFNDSVPVSGYDLRVYYNQRSRELIFEALFEVKQDVEFKIWDATGRYLGNYKIENLRVSLEGYDVTFLPAGVYLFKFSYAGNVMTQKIPINY